MPDPLFFTQGLRTVSRLGLGPFVLRCSFFFVLRRGISLREAQLGGKDEEQLGGKDDWLARTTLFQCSARQLT